MEVFDGLPPLRGGCLRIDLRCGVRPWQRDAEHCAAAARLLE
jgi:hypothetical protein